MNPSESNKNLNIVVNADDDDLNNSRFYEDFHEIPAYKNRIKNMKENLKRRKTQGPNSIQINNNDQFKLLVHNEANNENMKYAEQELNKSTISEDEEQPSYTRNPHRTYPLRNRLSMNYEKVGKDTSQKLENDSHMKFLLNYQKNNENK